MLVFPAQYYPSHRNTAIYFRSEVQNIGSATFKEGSSSILAIGGIIAATSKSYRGMSTTTSYNIYDNLY